MIVLGVAVTADLHNCWRQWLAPDLQPFFVDSLRPWPRSTLSTTSLSSELAHTYKAWRIDRSLKTLWLDEAAFLGMSRSQRATLVRAQVDHGRGAVPGVRRWSDVLDPAPLRSQGDAHRFVWWPSLVRSNPDDVLSRVVSAAPDGSEVHALPSRHGDVAPATWDRSARAVPQARRLAGSFPLASGPNCFGTVLAAAGVAGVEYECVLQTEFLTWLDSACRPGGHDDDAGTVLVWHDSTGTPVHAAVTIGDGWALEKVSGEWWTPRAVRSVGDVIRTARARGHHLERRRIAPDRGRPVAN